MNEPHKKLWFQTIRPVIHDLIFAIDVSLEFVYAYIEVPIQHAFSQLGNISHCYYRRRSFIDFSRLLTQILVDSYATTCFLFLILLIFGYIFSITTQRHYFVDPFLSNNRQCINIKFVRIINSNKSNIQRTHLEDNFIRENHIIRDEIYQRKTFNYSQLYQLLRLIENDHYVICQRSLYIFARFHVYSSLLHSNYSNYHFFIEDYTSSFPIDQPPFIDLCLHSFNHSHLEDIKSVLVPLTSAYYSSINLLLFDFKFTQVSITLYKLNRDSENLERVSIHTGWLYDLYSNFYFFKYNHALSTVLFDGLPTHQHSIDYFDYINIPLPADSLLGLTEMVQQPILISPLCHLKYNTSKA